MREISKAEFIRKITNGQSVFIGISPSGNELPMVRERLNLKAGKRRYCVCKSNNHLIFGVTPPTSQFVGDSHLYLSDVKPHTFYKCYEEDEYLVVEQKWLDIDWNGEIQDTVYKYMYYAIA